MADARKIGMGIAAGCAVIIGLMAVSAGACGVWLWREGRRMQAEMRDPVARQDKVLEVLGTDRIPDGYYPTAAFSVPFVMEMAVLSDREPDEEGEVEGFDERGFIYVQMLGVGQNEQELRDFFEGRTDDYGVLEDNGMNLDIDEILGRGVFDLAGEDARAMYVTQRGSLAVGGSRGSGLTGMALIDCPQDERRRVALWFGPDPADDSEPAAAAEPEAPAAAEGDKGAEASLAGTPADPETLRAFLSNFRFCG
jgi:hypothetical protein